MKNPARILVGQYLLFLAKQRKGARNRFFDSSACSACNDRWWLLRFVAQDGRFRDPVLVYRSGNGLAVDCFEENHFCGS